MSTPANLPSGDDAGAQTLPRVDRLKAILAAGIRAPSAENRHFLRFDLRDNHLQLVSTDTPTWAAQPHRRMLALVACGAVVENMSLQSGTFGLTQVTQWFPDPSRIELVAECRWQPTARHPDDLSAAIDKRLTNRHFYARQPVDPAALQHMADAVGSVPRASLLWLAGASRAVALRAIRIAETERFRREALHEELFSAVRFDLGWKETADQGLPPGALAVEPPMRPLFRALRHWPLMHALTRLGTHHMLGLRAADLPCRLAPAMGLLLHDASDPAMAAVDAGRALERAWLAASSRGLAFQPLAAAPVLARQRPGDGWVSASAHKRIVEALDLLTAGRPMSAFMFFRTGHAREPQVVTARPPIERFF